MSQSGNLGLGNIVGGPQPDVGLPNPISALQTLARQEIPRSFLPAPGQGSQLQNMQLVGGHNAPQNGSSQGSQNPQLQAALASPSPLQQQQQQQQMPMSQQQGPPPGMQTFGGNIVGQGKPRMGDMMSGGVQNPRMVMSKANMKQQVAAAQKTMHANMAAAVNKQAVAQVQMSQQSPEGMMMQQVQGQVGGGPFGQGPSPGPVPRQGTPTQFMSQSPAGMVSMHNPLTPTAGGAQGTPPVSYMPSPNSQIIPSPSMGLGGPPSIRTPGTTGLPSPSSTLNTPVGSVSAQSPASRALEDQAYLEKVKQLSKYIEPLSRMIARIDKDESAYDKKKDLSKMKNLLDILSNPAKRLPMDTLLKCEQVLEKLDLKVKSTETLSGTFLPGPCKEQNMCQPLLDAVVHHINSPVLNHTLQRTFGPAMGALYGPPLRSPSPTSSPTVKKKKKKMEEESRDIPDVLQGEIARLDQRFKVNLDPIQHCGSRTVHLVCQLDDKSLPCVPPITVTVPEQYPKKPPKCDTSSEEYESTPFLQAVQKTLVARMSQMPDHFSMTSLLDNWEMSVRQACSPCSAVSSTTEY